MRSKPLRAISLTAAAGLLLVSFQNCGKAGFDGAGEENLDLQSSSKTDTDPFAFDASFDQISYNSCFGQTTAGKPGFYTLKAGAYSAAGGMKLSTAFESFVQNGETIKPIYPETTITDAQIKNYLAASGANREALPQMALRTRSNVQQVRSADGNVTEGVDFIPMLGDLTDDRWMHPIVTGKSTMSNLFFSFGPEDRRRLEASLSYNSNEGTAFNMRNDLSDKGMLALTYRPRADLGDARGSRAPANAGAGVAYGRGYQLMFGQGLSTYTQCLKDTTNNCNAPATALHTLAPTNILTAITEVNLENPNQQVAQWNCDAKRRYVVVRSTDAATYCPPDPVSYLSNPNLRREYELVRRHLSVKDWHVNLSLRCVSPKNGGCYDNKYTSQGALVNIEYDQTMPCFQDIDIYKAQYGTPFPSKMCAQYVSFCMK